MYASHFAFCVHVDVVLTMFWQCFDTCTLSPLPNAVHVVLCFTRHVYTEGPGFCMYLSLKNHRSSQEDVLAEIVNQSHLFFRRYQALCISLPRKTDVFTYIDMQKAYVFIVTFIKRLIQTVILWESDHHNLQLQRSLCYENIAKMCMCLASVFMLKTFRAE